MAKKKKKKYQYDPWDAEQEFLPGGSAAKEMRERERDAQTRGHTSWGYEPEKHRYNTKADIEAFKPIESQTYKRYVASIGSDINKAGVRGVRSYLSKRDLKPKNYFDTARYFRALSGSDFTMKTKSQVNRDFKKDVDKRYSLKRIIDKASRLNAGNTKDLIRRSYNDINAVRELGIVNKDADSLLKDIEKYKKAYGNNKDIDTASNYVQQISQMIKQQAKGGSAVSNKALEQWNAPLVKSPYDRKAKSKQDIEREYALINEMNMREKFKDNPQFNGKVSDKDFKKLTKAKPSTPAEKEWLEQEIWNRGTDKQLRKKYSDTTAEMLQLQEERDRLSDAIDTSDKNMKSISGQMKSGIDKKAANKRIAEIDERLKDLNDFKEKYYQAVRVPENMAGISKQDSKKLADIVAKRDLYEDEEREYLKQELLNRDDAIETYKYIANKLAKEKSEEQENLTDMLVKKSDSDSTVKKIEKYQKEKIDTDEFKNYRALQLELAQKIAPELVDKIQTELFASKSAYDLSEADKQRAKDLNIDLGYTSAEDIKKAFGKELSQYGDELANDIFEVAKRNAEQETAQLAQAQAQQYGEDNPLSSILFGAVNRNVGGISTFAKKLDNLGDLEPEDYNDKYAIMTRTGQAYQEGGTEAIDNKFLKSVYQAVNSGADMGLATLEAAPLIAIPGVGPKLATDAVAFIMSTEAGASSMIEGHDMGMSDREALTYGLESAFGEGIGEKLSIELILNQLGGKGKTLKNVISGLGKSFLSEGSEEIGTDLFNRVVDNYFNGENSMYNRQIKEYQKQGLTKDQARDKVDSDFIKQLGEEFTVGGLAGLMFGGGVAAVSSGANALADAKNTKDVGKIINDNLESGTLDEEDLDYMTEVGMNSNVPEINEKAAKIKSKIDNGESVSDMEIGSLSRDLIAANEGIDLEAPEELDTIHRRTMVEDLAKESSIPNNEIDKMLNAYDESVNPRLYVNNYNMFYTLGKDANYREKGKNGLSDVFENMPQYIDYANEITPNAAGVAFSAGKSSVSEIPQIDLNTKPTGTFINETDRNDDVTSYMAELSQRTGLDTVLTKDIPKHLGTQSRGASGIEGFAKLKSGRIFVTPDADNMLVALHHEVAEQMKNLIPEKYAALEKYVTTKGYKTIGANAFQDVIENYKKAYPESNETELRKEYTCDLFATLMTSPEAFNQFYEEEFSKLDSKEKQSIIDTLRELINAVIAKLNEFMEKRGVKANTEFALDETEEGTSELKTKDDAIKYALDLYHELKNKIDSAEVTESESTDKDTQYSKKAEVDSEGNELSKEQPTTNEDIRYSKKLEEEYDQAVKDNDEKKAAELVQDYAVNKGYTERVYHGTESFGFTQIDLNKTIDKQSFFATTDLGTAETYSDEEEVRRINDKLSDEEINNLSDKQISDYLTKISDYEITVNKKNNKKVWEHKDIDDDLQLSKKEALEEIRKHNNRTSGNYEFYANVDDFLYVDSEDSFWDELQYSMIKDSEDGLKNPKTLKLIVETHLKDTYRDKFNYIKYNKDTDTFEISVEGEPLEKQTLEQLYDVYSKDIDFDDYGTDDYIWDTHLVSTYAKAQGYKGVNFDGLNDWGGVGDSKHAYGGTVYIFFNPTEQVKSADPFTYDDNGDLVPLEKRFDKNYNDIRYSLKAQSEEKLQQQNRRLKKENVRYQQLVEDLAKQIKGYSLSHKVSSAHVNEVVTDLRKEFDSTIPRQELYQLVSSLYTRIYNNKNNINNSDVISAAENVIRSIMDYGPLTQESEGLLKEIRKTAFSLSESQKKEVEHVYGKYADWLRDNKGNFTVRNNALNIDQIWSGVWLSEDNPYAHIFEQYGGRELSDKDMALKLTEIVRNARETNGLEEKFMMSEDDIVKTSALDLLQRYLDTPSLADELYELRQERKNAYREAYKLGRAEGRAEQVAKNMLRDEQDRSNKLEKTLKEVFDKLDKQLTEPTYNIKGHLAPGWEKAVAEFSELISFNTRNPGQFQKVRMDNAYNRYREAIKNNDPNEENYKAEYERWKGLYEQFNKRADQRIKAIEKILNTEEDGTVDNEVLRQRLMSFAESINPESGEAIPYYRLTNDQKQELITIGRMILHENEYQNRIRGKYKILSQTGAVLDDVRDITEQGLNELNNSGKAKGTNPLRTFANSILTPEVVFDSLGGYHKNNIFKQMWQMVADAQEDEWYYQKETLSILDSVLKQTDRAKRLRAELEQRYDKKHLVDIGVKGRDANGNEVDVLIPRGMVLELLTHISKPQNLKHLSEGGLTIPDLKGYYKSDATKAYGKGQILVDGITDSLSNFNQRIDEALEGENFELADKLETEKFELRQWAIDKWLKVYDNLYSELTEYELEVLDAMQKTYQKSGELMGKVSDAMYGVNLFDEINGVADYFPISTDTAYLGAEIDYGAGVEANLGASGFAQKRVNSNKPLLLGDIFVTTSNHLNKTSKYYAYLIPQNNLNNFLNGQVSGYETNLKKAMQMRDKTKLEYIENWKRDMFGGNSVVKDPLGQRASKAMSWIRSNYAAATLNLNAKVALYQPLSYFMALTAGGTKNTIKGLVNMKQSDAKAMINEATNMLWARDNKGGMVETETLKEGKSVISQSIKWLDRVTNGHLDWIHNRDISTVTRLGGVAKAILEEEGLTPDTEEWNKEFAVVYKDLMTTGQPLADTVYRPEIQRSKHEIVKFVAMFYTVRLQMVNTCVHELQKYRTYKQDFTNNAYGVTKEDVQKQRGRAVRALVATTLSQASVVAVQALITSMLYHTIFDIKDDDNDVTPESITKGFTKNYAKTMIEMIPLLGEIYEATDYAIDKFSGNSSYGKEYEGISLNGLDLLTDLVNDAINSAKKIKDGNYTAKDLNKELETIFKILGIPYGNITKVINGVSGKIADYMDNGEFDFSNLQDDKDKLSMYVQGKLSDEEAKDIVTEANKEKIQNAVEKKYKEGVITHKEAVNILDRTKLYKPSGSYKNVPYNTYIEGKVAKWEINAYKEDYQNSLTSGGAETAESRQIRQEIAKLDWNSAFYSTENAKKTPSEKLEDMFKKWRDSREQ